MYIDLDCENWEDSFLSQVGCDAEIDGTPTASEKIEEIDSDDDI